MRKITLEQFKAEMKATGAKRVEDVRFLCPMCRTPQSATDLIAAGAGATMDDVEKYVAFSCIGRWTGAKPPRERPDGNPCDWTLGGLFSLHELEVITPDGNSHPRFELAPPV